MSTRDGPEPNSWMWPSLSPRATACSSLALPRRPFRSQPARRSLAAAMADQRDDRGDVARTEESLRSRDTRMQADADEIAANLVQSQADADQWALDEDQHASDNDQALADREQRFADQDQAAADAAHVHAREPNAGQASEARAARETTRRGRDAAAMTRSRTTADRMMRATLRDAVSRLRNLTPGGRDRSAAQASEESDAVERSDRPMP
jgi:hypothetical protein